MGQRDNHSVTVSIVYIPLLPDSPHLLCDDLGDLIRMDNATLSRIDLPSSYNYVACFLTFACQLRCPYCINHHGGDLVKARRMDGDAWIKGINRLNLPKDCPVTLQGGEPTVHRDFVRIINGIRPDIPIDVLTNFEMPLEFWKDINPARLRRNAPYASIRVSWHRGQHDLESLLYKVAKAQKQGFHIGIWTVDHPEYHEEVLKAQHIASALKIDFRLKEFLGPWKGKTYGTFSYADSVNSLRLRYCECRTTELLIGPDGHIYRCHSDLYASRLPIGHILQEKNPLVGQWIPCSVLGKCNSCDTKIKNNRYQQFGHSSVEIRKISQSYAPNKDHIDEVVNTYGKSEVPKI